MASRADPAGLRRSFITPEGVDLRLELATAGARAGAFLLDALMIVGVLTVVTIVLGLSGIAGKAAVWRQAMEGIWLLGLFVLRNFWFALF